MITVLDRLLAAVGLVLASPALVLSAVGIRATSPGPVLYRAQRAGRDGVPFTMYKLRTMTVGHESAGRITGGRDSRVTRVGGVLRRIKLDEVPQLVNVVRGEMSLVGPRPEDVTIVREHYDAMMWESLAVRPGMTGPGSLDYFADESALPPSPIEAERVYLDELLPRKIALDLVYVRHRSVRYHLELVARTVGSVLGDRFPARERVAAERAEAERILAERRSS